MKVIIWIHEDDLDTLLVGDPVDYFEREPGAYENVIQVTVDTDTYQKLKDNKSDDRPNSD